MLRNNVSGSKRRLNEELRMIILLYSLSREGNSELHANDIARHC